MSLFQQLTRHKSVEQLQAEPAQPATSAACSASGN